MLNTFTTVSQSMRDYWRDTLCQNNLKLNYAPQSLSASFQAPPLYDFIGNTMVQVYTGIAAEENDTNLSYSTLLNGFGNISILTATPVIIYKFKRPNVVYYNDIFTMATGTLPDQTGSIDEIMGTIGLGFNNTFLFSGDYSRLNFLFRHRAGLGIGRYHGLLKDPNRLLVLYSSLQFRISTESGALFFEFPLIITQINIDPSLVLGYTKRIGQVNRKNE